MNSEITYPPCICPGCNTAKTLLDPDSALYFVCDQCNSYIDRFANQKIATLPETDYEFHPNFEIGSELEFKSKKYRVIGQIKYSILHTNMDYFWDYYVIQTSDGDTEGIGLSSGHLTHYVPIDNAIIPKSLNNTVVYEGKYYDRFDQYTYTATAAKGEFPYHILEELEGNDYILPPEIYTISVGAETVTLEKGIYIEENELKFTSIKKAPFIKNKKEVHPIQPNPRSKKFFTGIKIMAVFAIFWTLFLSLYYSLIVGDAAIVATDYQHAVKTADSSQSALASSNIIGDSIVRSRSFELKRPYNTAEVEISTNISQSWLALEMELVNENTGELYALTKELEYYSGSSDGEYWSEGSQNGSAQIGHLPKGRYHINYHPVYNKDLDLTGIYWHAEIKINAPVYSNLFIAIGICIILGSIFWFIRNKVEYKRWSNSPFNEENE